MPSAPTRVIVNRDHVLAYYDGEAEPRRLDLMEGADLIERQLADDWAALEAQTSVDPADAEK